MTTRLQLGVACLALALFAPARAAVTFNFIFNDVANNTGIGFADPTHGATRRTTLTDYANSVLGAALNHTATVDIRVNNSVTSGGFLASAGPLVPGIASSFQGGLLRTHIITGSDPSLGDPDATMTWNFDPTINWAVGSSATAGQFDFRSVALHELTHALGFLSAISSTGASALGSNTYSYFDSFLKNGSSTLLIHPTTRVFQGSANDLITDVFFTGDNAMAVYGGAVPIYSPGTFAAGSSLGHVDNIGAFAGDPMNFSIGAGNLRQTWSTLDLAILSDLGYSITAIPEPATAALTLGSASLLALGWFRRRRVA